MACLSAKVAFGIKIKWYESASMQILHYTISIHIGDFEILSKQKFIGSDLAKFYRDEGIEVDI